MDPVKLLCFISFYLLTGVTCHSYDPDGWKAAADYLLEAMDTKANPCKDFYQFACGNWKRKYGGQFSEEMDKVRKTHNENLIKLISDIKADSSDTPVYQKRLKVFYDQCLHAPTDHVEILKSIYMETVKHIGPMPMLAPDRVQYQDPYYLLGFIQRQFDTDVLLRARVILIEDECGSKPAIQLRPFETMLDDKFNQTFPAKLIKLALDIGANVDEENVTRRISQLVQFHQSPNYTWEYEGTLFRLSELPIKLNPKVNWEQLFGGLMPPDLLNKWKNQDPQVKVYLPRYFNHLHIWMSQLTYTDLADLAYLRIFHNYLSRFNASYFEFEEESRTLEHRCLIYVFESDAAVATARLYFDSTLINHNPDPKLMSIWKNDVELLCEAILSGFNYMIQTADWLEVKSKLEFVELVKSVEFISGIPQWFLNDTYVLRHIPAFDAGLTRFQNDLRMYRQKFEWKLELLVAQPSQLQLHYLKDTAYAYHTSYFSFLAYGLQGVIMVSLGTTLPPFHIVSYPMPVKFGILGKFISRALMYNIFHTMVNSERPLVTEQEWKLFEKLMLCIIKHFSGYCFPELNFCISGGNRFIMQQSIPALEGLKLAYISYKFTSQIAGGQMDLPGLEEFTQDQLFFISAARPLCTTDENVTISSESGIMLLPPQAALELSMMNFPAFAQAFNCLVGEKFAPLHTCSLWGHFLEPNIEKVKLMNESDSGTHQEG